MIYLFIYPISIERFTALIQNNGLLPEHELQPSPGQPLGNHDDSQN